MRLANRDAEEAVIGGVLLTGSVPATLIDSGLKPEHFYWPQHRNAYERLIKLHDDGEPIDPITADLTDLTHYTAVPMLSDLGGYARAVVDEARWRTRVAAARTIIEAAEDRDESTFSKGEALLTAPERTVGVWEREALAAEFFARLEAGVVEGFPVPFFNRKLRRRTVTLVGGWTSHGKTVWLDQWARDLHAAGYRVWAWLNEMTAEERVNRHVSAVSGVPLGRLEEACDLHRDELARAARAANSIPFDIVECAGWSANDIARDIRIRKPDVALIDILHRVPYRDERDLAHISQVLGDCAKLANCALIATVHLNEKRVLSAARPQPTLGDIKGASALKQDADNVMFVWRQDDETTGFPTNVGQIYYAKARQGRLGGVAVAFDGEHARFDRDLRRAVA